MVEQRTENPRVVGSIPTGGTKSAAGTVQVLPVPVPRVQLTRQFPFVSSADLAHLVERNLAKVEVAGSTPVIRSNGIVSPIPCPSLLNGAIAKR